jgi:hypothetical protein
METFTLIVVVGLVVTVLALVALGFWHPLRASEVTNPEMIEGQNLYRRRRGQADLTEEEVRRTAASRQRRSIERAQRR